MANIISTRSVPARVALAGLLLSGLAACASTPSRPPVSQPQAPTLTAPLERMEITSAFGPRNGRPHEGIDLRARADTPVGSAGDGVVRFSGWQSGFGRLVIIEHAAAGAGVLETFYAHLSGAVVHKGDRVRRGELIGFVGATGNATGPHLHFEVHEGGVPVDPMRWLGPAQTVLR